MTITLQYNINIIPVSILFIPSKHQIFADKDCFAKTTHWAYLVPLQTRL